MRHRYGWKPDVPDSRDFTLDHPAIRDALARCGPSPGPTTLPESAELGEFFAPVGRREHFVSSPVAAGIALMEYFQRRSSGDLTACSALFVDEVAHRLANIKRKCDLDLRTTLKALIRFGAPPAQLFLTTRKNLKKEAPPFLYGFADRFASVLYLRIAKSDDDGRQTLNYLKAYLAAGFPVAFGFPVPASIGPEADIPYRPKYDNVLGGAAAVAVGYDDRRVSTDVGMLRIRGCWGPQWGEDGFGWLPYRYVQEALAVDFWTVCSAPWMASSEFHRPMR